MSGRPGATNRHRCGATWSGGRRAATAAARDDGAALVAAVALVGALLAVLLALGVVADLLGARQRAADVADLAALAGVSTVLPSEAEACRAASWVATAQAAVLRSCALVDGDVVVAVSVPPRAPWSGWLALVLGGAPEPAVTARAGRR